MFVGEYSYRVDNKGRLPLPPRFRKELEEGLVLTLGPDNCIMAYPKADWIKITANQAPTNFLSSDKERKINRFLFSNANEVSVDNQGRIALPASLREKCGIGDDVIINGLNSSFEIWNPAQWQKESLTANEARQLMEVLEERK
jgi:MraZ protein